MSRVMTVTLLLTGMLGCAKAPTSPVESPPPNEGEPAEPSSESLPPPPVAADPAPEAPEAPTETNWYCVSSVNHEEKGRDPIVSCGDSEKECEKFKGNLEKGPGGTMGLTFDACTAAPKVHCHPAEIGGRLRPMCSPTKEQCEASRSHKKGFMKRVGACAEHGPTETQSSIERGYAQG